MFVVFISDNNFVQYVVVTIRSLLSNASNPGSLMVKLINDNLPENNLEKLRYSLHDFSPILYLEIIDVDRHQVRTLSPKCEQLFQAAYHRINVEKFLREYIGRIVYLDSDIVVNHDICELFKVDLGEYTIGAVQNEGLKH